MNLADAIASADMLAISRCYIAAGLSVIPIRADGSKAPAVSKWEPFQDRAPSDDELRSWFGSGRAVGVGLVCGRVSGNLAVLDFESADAWDRWLNRAIDTPFAKLLSVSPQVRTPGGGRHVYCRIKECFVAGGVLARRADKKTAVEVRGQGHYVVAPGSPVACHVTNRPYTLVTEGWLAHGR